MYSDHKRINNDLYILFMILMNEGGAYMYE